LSQNFSRKADRFYPLLSVELFGSYSNSGEIFNATVRLYRFVQQNIETIVNAIISEESDSESDNEILVKTQNINQIIVLKKENGIKDEIEVKLFYLNQS